MRNDVCQALFMENEIKICYAKAARKFGCDYRTVKRYLTSDPSILKRKLRNKVSILEPYKEIIKEKIDRGAPVVAIYKFIKTKGYKGKLTTVKNFSKTYVKERYKEVTVRFETSPGFQSQVDRKENFILTNRKNEQFNINIFLIVSGFSRMKYIELTTDTNQTTLFRCLNNAFTYFGGSTKEILFDNMKTVIDRARSQFDKPVLNERFYQYSKDAQFKPVLCVAYRPQTKGKVETVAKLMNRLRVYNNEFDTLDDLNAIVRLFNEELNREVCQATNRMPEYLFQKEKEYLKPVNLEILSCYVSEKPIERKVQHDCLVSFLGKKYSVPKQYIGKKVVCKETGNTIEIFFKEQKIAEHKITAKDINYDANHYSDALKEIFDNDNFVEYVAKRNLGIYDNLGEIYEQDSKS